MRVYKWAIQSVKKPIFSHVSFISIAPQVLKLIGNEDASSTPMNLRKWLRKLFDREEEFLPSHFASQADEDDSNLDPFNPFPEPVELPLTDILDLHTIHPRDVKRVVEEYLYQARRANLPVVRIIHGKGIGVQREMVRSILARTSYVYDWTDAPADAGGLGATIVRLSRGIAGLD